MTDVLERPAVAAEPAEAEQTQYRVLGKSVRRVDAVDKVTGAARYGADVNLPGQLWAKFYHSPHGHARIKRIDTSKAERVPGVVRVVTQETIGLYPPAYMIGRQALVDTEIAGHRIKKGNYVLVNVLGIHRRDDYFSDPLAFQPDRFVEDPARGTYIPFGLGPRVCIGNQFAMLEAGVLAATIFARALPAAAPGDVAPDPLVTLRPSPGLPFRVAWRS